MNIHETRALCSWLGSLIPSQQFDDQTPEAWQPILCRIPVEDARIAILTVAQRERYIAPRDIVVEVGRLRRQRLEAAGFNELTPNVNPDDVGAYLAEWRALQSAIASGQMDAVAVADYERGATPPLTGAAPHLAIDQPLVQRELALGSVAHRT